MDLGPASAFAENSKITITVALNLRNTAQMEKLIQAVHTQGSPEYQHFLSPDEFAAQFGPSAATVATVSKQFEAEGLAVTRASTGHLHVTGSVAQIEQAFAVQLHTFAVAGTAQTSEYRYRAPLAAPHLPAAVASSVRAVLGLDTRPRLAPRLRNPLRAPLKQPSTSNTNNTTDPPGEWTVLDYAQYYDLNPLYKQGLTGKGRTLAIVTLASFTQSDAYNYWSAIGLSVSPNRITEVQIDGGSGPPSDAGGSDETTLDVEQSGGLAPGAKIIVYEAPNTNQGFADAFAACIDSNRAETVSTSWGEWEGFDGPDPTIGNGTITDPVTGQPTDIIQANDDMLAQAALQGQTWFAASGDSGAFQATARALPSAPSPGQPLSYNLPISVDDPSMQRYMTSAGGTTVPGLQQYQGPDGTIIDINVKQEQAWGWDYLQPLVGRAMSIAASIRWAVAVASASLLLRPFYPVVHARHGQHGARSVTGAADAGPGAGRSSGCRPASRDATCRTSRPTPIHEWATCITTPPATPPIRRASTRPAARAFVAPELNGVSSLLVQGVRHRIGLA